MAFGRKKTGSRRSVSSPECALGSTSPQRRLGSDRAGVTAMEFGLIAPVFLTLLLAIFEFSLSLLAQQALDHAVAVAARQIQIGNAKTAATFQADLCAAGPSILISSCSTSVQIYVTSGTTFAGLTQATVSSAGTLSPTTFSAGTAGSDILVEAVYRRPYVFGLISSALGSTGGALISVVAVQSEPY
jgi:Flp pilus assembly protein TadG